MSIDQTQPFTISKLLYESGDYQIPVYQRNYAWGRPQIRALIQDIYDYYIRSQVSLENYYIGSLVVAKKEKYFEVLDGQQRFTTLNLMALFLKSKVENAQFSNFNGIRLKFESREKSEILLHSLWKLTQEKSIENKIDGLAVEHGHHSILMGYKIISEEILKIVQKNDLEKFADYLFEHVVILRTIIPALADVTHYFDALNNRGEQLEAHEVIKAHFLSLVSTDEHDRQLFNQIWTACQDMYKYVAFGFSVEQRRKIFGTSYHDWLLSDYDELKLCLPIVTVSKAGDNQSDSYGDQLTLEQILKLDVIPVTKKHVEEESAERFTSTIDYPNFLMHVLKIYVKVHLQDSNSSAIILDDKTLLDSFKTTILDVNSAKAFMYTLLKTRYLFDLYVIKRENSNQYKGWSLKKPKNYDSGNVSYVNTFSNSEHDDLALEGGQRNLVMLLSAFHVSYPTQARKNWLLSVMYWLFDHSQGIHLDAYLKSLENLARTLIKRRYLSSAPQAYEKFMYAEKLNYETSVSTQDIEKYFPYGKIPHFCFNYLDYILLKNKRGSYTKFYFSYKDSVEHFYPQHPKVGESLPDNLLHSFGNLGLVNQRENSILTNDMPIQKTNWLRKHTKVPISLKLELMMELVENEKNDWNEDSIKTHQKDMVKLLLDDLS